jgi:hypothetical protein
MLYANIVVPEKTYLQNFLKAFAKHSSHEKHPPYNWRGDTPTPLWSGSTVVEPLFMEHKNWTHRKISGSGPTARPSLTEC